MSSPASAGHRSAPQMNVGKTNSSIVPQLNPSIGESKNDKSITAQSIGSSGRGPDDDHMQVSNLSSYLAAALSGSPAHLSKLNSLATEVQSGAYQVDAGVISDRIITRSLGFGAG
jgi:anti-sigma28 factor (negative regulator of flagellin synthesis)